MDFFFNQEHLLLRSRVRSWVEKNLIPGIREEANIDKQARQLVSHLGQEGFTAYVAAKKFGGIRENVQARDLCILREELARGSALADTMFAMQALGSYPITIAGSEEQKQRYLPPIARGEAIAAFALTEPQAGSDLSSMETRAGSRGGEYRLPGGKGFISDAGLGPHPQGLSSPP